MEIKDGMDPYMLSGTKGLCLLLSDIGFLTPQITCPNASCSSSLVWKLKVTDV
jgi:hypothetical protein